MTKQLEIINDPKYIPVLDHGFVGFVDNMGTDASIVQAARVSYGQGTKSILEDRGLIRYLVRNKHTSPIEMCQIKLHLKVPILVMRQWVRHRTACLGGASNLYFDLPGALNKNKRSRRNISIQKFYSMWHEGSTQFNKRLRKETGEIISEKLYTVPELSNITYRTEEHIRILLQKKTLIGHKVEAKINEPSWRIWGKDWIKYANTKIEQKIDIKNRLSKMKLRMCDEITGNINYTHVTDIWESGIKPVYKITLENGYTIEMTKDHLCLMKSGWKTLEKAIDLHLKSDLTVSTWVNSDEFSVNGVPAYQDKEWLQNKVTEMLTQKEIADEAGMSPATIKKWLTIYGIKYSKEAISNISSRNQLGRKKGPQINKSPMTPQKLAKLRALRAVRAGAASNWWKGGISNGSRSNELIRWTNRMASQIHKNNSYMCVICSDNYKLNAHHIDPIWHAPEKAMMENNLITLCQKCHQTIHSNNLELDFVESHKNGTLFDFWNIFSNIKRESNKKRKLSQKLLRTYSKIKNIEYVGEKMTYDLSVSGPYHNFVANGFIVHNSLNEYSGRYSIMTDEFYMPESAVIQPQSRDNKQGRLGELSEKNADGVKWMLDAAYKHSYDIYKVLLGDRMDGEEIYDPYGSDDPLLDDEFPGIAREMARAVLPVANYTEFYWSQNLHNMMHLLKLRLDPHAQYEIRVFAQAVYDLVKPIYPIALEAFNDYVLEASTNSRMETEILKMLLSDKRIEFANMLLSATSDKDFAEIHGLSIRELKDFAEKWNLPYGKEAKALLAKESNELVVRNPAPNASPVRAPSGMYKEFNK